VVESQIVTTVSPTNDSKLRAGLQALLDVGERAARAVLSNRGLSILLLAVCGLLAVSPWLRPAMSRDLRGIHIPLTSAAGAPFFPPYAAEVPRPWLMTSVATPILAAVAIGIVLVLIRRRDQTAVAMGLMLAVSLPTAAAALWNHPGLMEFFESEVRQRAVLRDVFHLQSDELLAGSAPDRLATRGTLNTPAGHHHNTHPIVLPFRYMVYGPWVVVVAAIGLMVATSGTFIQRLTRTAAWAGVGVLLAVATTWPRWVAEYQFFRADAFENRQQLADAELALDGIAWAMPELEMSRRYQLARGRLVYRQDRQNPDAAFFVAHQKAVEGNYEEARAVLSPLVAAQDPSVAKRELLAEIMGHLAAAQVEVGDYTAAELQWAEASRVAPWMPGHWIAENTTALVANPGRADGFERDILPRLAQVGDRLVTSDVATVLGDAYFKTGDFAKARLMYDRSLDNFHLPKYANLKAQSGRLGM
jgi:tetratricopeptide (TPR) repeat protein